MEKFVALLPEDEEDGAAEAERGPDEVEAEFLAHEEQSERHEDRQRDDLLHDLQLRQREGRVADSVRRHLQQVFEQCNAPTDDRNPPQKRSFSPVFPVFPVSRSKIEYQCATGQRAANMTALLPPGGI